MHQAFQLCTHALPPLDYCLFFPWRGVYVKDINASRRTFKTTGNRSSACALPDQDARAFGRCVSVALREPVELRLAHQ
jgi:hypothetical protein